MGKQCAAHAAATQKPASDEEPEHPALPTSTSTLAFIVLVLAIVLVPLLAALAQKMGEDRATNAAATQYPAADQETQDPAMIFVFALALIVVDVLVFVLVFLFATLAPTCRNYQNLALSLRARADDNRGKRRSS